MSGKFLYAGHAMYTTRLAQLTTLHRNKLRPTEETMKQTIRFLDYVASQDEPVYLNIEK